MKLHVISLGCQMSAADGEEMSRPFVDRGFTQTTEIDDADAVLINTCTVRQHAEDRAVSLIGRLKLWKKKRPERFLIVAGCAAERLGGWIQKKFPHVDLVVGAKSIEQYPQILNAALKARFDWAKENQDVWEQGNERRESLDLIPSPLTYRRSGQGFGEQGPNSPLPEIHGSVTAYATIMRGCNYTCAYCIVPAVRGREIYRPMDTILSEIRRKVSAGAKEIMLLGQTVNSYRSADGKDFADLLRAVDALPGLDRIRFMSPHPYYLSDRMIAAMADCPKVCRHLHLPLQSGSNRILKSMRRNYTVEQYAAGVEKLRRAIPDTALTTDVIAGFPGETEEDFQKTLDFLSEVDPCAAYCFKFSARPGTQAADLPEQLPQKVVDERHRRLLEFMDEKTRLHLKSWLGKKVLVLLETEQQGKTQYHFNAKITSPGHPPKQPGGQLSRMPFSGRSGDTVAAVITGVSRTGLEAQLCDASENLVAQSQES